MIILSIFSYGEFCGGLNVDIEETTEISDSFDDLDENSDDSNEKLNFVYQHHQNLKVETKELKNPCSIQNSNHALNGHLSIIVPPPEV